MYMYMYQSNVGYPGVVYVAHVCQETMLPTGPTPALGRYRPRRATPPACTALVTRGIRRDRAAPPIDVSMTGARVCCGAARAWTGLDRGSGAAMGAEAPLLRSHACCGRLDTLGSSDVSMTGVRALCAAVCSARECIFASPDRPRSRLTTAVGSSLLPSATIRESHRHNATQASDGGLRGR